MKIIKVILLLLCITAGIIHLQVQLTAFSSRVKKAECLTYVPRDAQIKAGLLGFETTLAHMLWIRTVVYFGGHYLTDKNYPWLVKMVDFITRLNPHFYPAYEFAGIMLPEVCNNPDAARVILERGLFHIGESKWNVPFYLSMLLYKYYGEYEMAAEYMALASQVNGAPTEKLAGVAAALYSKAGLPQIAENYLKLTIEASENPEVRRHLLGKLTENKRYNGVCQISR